MKLLTLTLAPAIDVTYQLKHPVCNGLNRADSFTLTPGGKGINVSRAIRAAAERDGDTGTDKYLLTVAPIGGESGAMFCSLLERESLPVTAVEIAAPLRVNVSAVPADGGSDCEINAPGAAMTEAELARAEELLLTNVSKGDVVCICGSCPIGVEKTYPAHLCAKVKERGAYCIIDCDGEALRAAVATEGSAPDFIKPNADELSRLCAELGLTVGAPTENARAVCALTGGRTGVIATLGGDGCLLATAEEVMTAVAQRVKPKRIKGAGDTFLGAFVYAHFVRSLPLYDSLLFASTTATAYVGGGVSAV